MKKTLFFFLVLSLNYVLISFIVFLFSYISLTNGKTYDFFWVKSIQEKLYLRGLRNIWQHNSDCVKFDKGLLYVPVDGECQFENPEFSTSLNFKDGIRKSKTNIEFSEKKDSVALLGDSIGMGWGVNDDQTFAYHLEKISNKKIYNLAVSSYGTVREIKKLLSSNIYDKVDTIIIQYHANDLFENKYLKINDSYTEDDFKKKFDKEATKLNKTVFFLKTFKTSLRLFFADIFDRVNPSANVYHVDFKEHSEYLEKLILENLKFSKKRIIVVYIKEPNMKIHNFPKSNKNIEYLLLPLVKEDFFIIDEHPNVNGHEEIAKKINSIL